LKICIRQPSSLPSSSVSLLTSGTSGADSCFFPLCCCR
jgi:hypothetical protein